MKTAMKKMMMAAAFAAMVAMAAWAGERSMPEWMFGIEVASVGATGQWVNVEHPDWSRVKVVRSDGAAGSVEKVVFRSRDISGIWDSKQDRIRFAQKCTSADFFFDGVGSSTSMRSEPLFGITKKGTVQSSAGLVGRYSFKTLKSGKKVCDFTVRCMTDKEWASWVRSHGEPPPKPQYATRFPPRLLGVDLPSVAPDGATLVGSKGTYESSQYGKHEFRTWRDSGTPISHKIFTSSENEYTWKTKTLCEARFVREFPSSMTDAERKVVEDEIESLAANDGFAIHVRNKQRGNDSASRTWEYSINAERADGLSLYTYIWHRKECDQLSVMISLHDNMTPKVKKWQEGLVEHGITEERPTP